MMDKKQFQTLLDMVMLNLEPAEQERIYSQMDQIIGFVDKLNEVSIEDNTLSIDPIKANAQRDYPTNTIWLSNVEHPIANNMIQIKFWRGEK
jgi:Asp-tRNA(Asn)/Glu-tRNA(Gln) amidotransferase C subunit